MNLFLLSRDIGAQAVFINRVTTRNDFPVLFSCFNTCDWKLRRKHFHFEYVERMICFPVFILYNYIKYEWSSSR